MNDRGVAARILTVALVAATCALPAFAGGLDGTYWGNRQEGWFWYQDPLPPPKPIKAPASTALRSPAKDGPSRDLAAFKDFQRRVEEAMQAATYNPSEANVLAFLTLWQESRAKASRFTDVAQAIAWRTPSVNDDFQGVRPTTPAATVAFDQMREQDQGKTMAALARTHGLFFIFRSDCPYCHAMAPMLKQLELKYGFTVYPISMDGGGLPEYPRPQRDNGIAARLMSELGIPPEEFQVPFTVLAQPGTREILPIGFGVMTAAEMAERINMVLKLRSEAKNNTGPRAARSAAQPLAANATP